MLRHIRKYNLFPLLALVTSLASGGKLMAQTCNNVDIKVVNSTGDEIKVKKFEYHDIDKGSWKAETGMFGADGFDKLEPGKFHSWTRDLGFQDEMQTQFKVTYAHHTGGSKWGPDKFYYSSTFTCVDNTAKTLTLTQ